MPVDTSTLSIKRNRCHSIAASVRSITVLAGLSVVLMTIPAKADAQPISSASHAEFSLGTLLYTADERKALSAKPSANQPLPNAAPPAASNLRIDGYVRPADGRPVIWVNGQIENDGVELRKDDDEVIIRVNQSNLQRLAPGQNTGEPELGEGNSITLHRGPVSTGSVTNTLKSIRDHGINRR